MRTSFIQNNNKFDAWQTAVAVGDDLVMELIDRILGMSINEDACQIYKTHSAENMSCLQHITLNIPRIKSTKLSMVAKQKRCMMNTAFWDSVLLAGFTSMVN